MLGFLSHEDDLRPQVLHFSCHSLEDLWFRANLLETLDEKHVQVVKLLIFNVEMAVNLREGAPFILLRATEDIAHVVENARFDLVDLLGVVIPLGSGREADSDWFLLVPPAVNETFRLLSAAELVEEALIVSFTLA